MNHTHVGFAAASTLMLLLGCAADPGTQPRDMSVAQHEAKAEQEQKAADEHAAQHDPAANARATQCSGKSGCWTSVSNPTARHAEDAQKHRELAQKHRAASAVLSETEARSCAGITADDRDISPFYHREDIASVSPLLEDIKSGKGVVKKEVGTTIVFRAVPGLTAEWLQRLADCHIARAAAVGHEMPEMNYCPLVVDGARAKVTSVGDGFAVNVSADEASAIAEIVKRGQALQVAASK